MPQLTKEILEKTERALNNDMIAKDVLYLLIDSDLRQVMGLFTSYEKATKYLIRYRVRLLTDCYEERDEDDIDQTYYDYIKSADNTYKILIVTHLNKTNTIYQIQNGNYFTYGDPEEYLTDSLDDWKSKITKYHKITDEWRDQCTVKVDPNLPEFYEMEDDCD
jgi:hypothetical protein